ncbi:hypothetical protein ACOXXX_19210 [Thalassococcus sp. BH17M4-6]|uniref:hypothetical protein n=1 Tax=Thalassococcus sp. BH17M4-6 TaxID=3413148 RepID=UPI003BDA3A19
MLDFVLIAIAAAFGGAGEGAPSVAAAPAAAPAGLVAEAQQPTGQFTTATEVRPILDMTKGNWVALRDYGGQDLLYVTHLLAWRCGLAQMRYAVNGGALQVWDLPPCHEGTTSPNALTPDDGLPYIGFPAGSVAQVQIELTYDDLTVDSATFARDDVLMP